VVLLVIHAVHADILLLSLPTLELWLSAIATYVTQNAGVLRGKIDTITSQVAVIVMEIENKDISPRLTRGPWKFSGKEAEAFAKALARGVDDNLM
jgi:hypothetical protein